MTVTELDSLGVRAAALATPAGVRANVALARSSGVPKVLGVDKVAFVTGAPGLVAATAVDAIAAPRLGRPAVLHVGADLPDWADHATVALTFDDGVDGETSPAHVVGLAPGGARVAPIAQATAALATLESIGLLEGVHAELLAAADVLDDTVADPQPFERLGRHIGHTMVLVYGAGAIGAAAAASWKAAVNRFAKVPAFANSVPGLDHDEICGWAQHGDVTRQVFTLVVLRHDLETADEAHRMDVTAETCEEIVGGVHTVRTDASSPAAALFDLMLRGELTAIEMAAQSGVDPGPTPIVERYA